MLVDLENIVLEWQESVSLLLEHRAQLEALVGWCNTRSSGDMWWWYEMILLEDPLKQMVADGICKFSVILSFSPLWFLGKKDVAGRTGQWWANTTAVGPFGGVTGLSWSRLASHGVVSPCSQVLMFSAHSKVSTSGTNRLTFIILDSYLVLCMNVPCLYQVRN